MGTDLFQMVFLFVLSGTFADIRMYQALCGRSYFVKEERKHFVFSGRVQGVGFRYSAYYLARLLELTGWVRNEYDGTVTMEVQGRPEQIDRLLQKLQSDRLIRIDHISATNLPLQAERTFCVR